MSFCLQRRGRDSMDYFVSLTKENIVDLISHAKFQIVYMAPAMDDDIAQGVVQFARRTSIDQVTVTLDLSADVYREGFGDEDALDTLSKAGIRVKHIEGLRVGVLVVDHKEWIFSPASKLTPKNVKVQQKNAISEERTDSIAKGDRIISLDAEQVLLFDDEKETLGKERVERLKRELRDQPEPNFDLQRL